MVNEMRRQAPPSEFSDAIDLCNLTLPAAGLYLGCSPHTAQSYAIGKRRTPPDVLRRLNELYVDTISGNDETDRYGNPIPERTMAVRRALRNPAAMVTFETIRMSQAPIADPDAGGDYDDGLPAPEEGSDR